MRNIVTFLRENPVQFLATNGTDGKPKVRPFQFMIEKNGKLFFCTSNQKNVFKEMQAQPYIELCVSSPKYEWLRLSGKATFILDKDIKQEIIEASPLVKSIYKEPGNPVFEIFYLDQAEAVLADFSGQPPRKVTL